jgi:hypothetical protein
MPAFALANTRQAGVGLGRDPVTSLQSNGVREVGQMQQAAAEIADGSHALADLGSRLCGHDG